MTEVTVTKTGQVTYDTQVAHNIGRAKAEEENRKYEAEKAREKAYNAYRGYREEEKRPIPQSSGGGGGGGFFSKVSRGGMRLFDTVGGGAANFMFGGGGGPQRRQTRRRSSGFGGGFNYNPDAAVGGFLSDIGEGGFFGGTSRRPKRRTKPKKKIKTRIRYVYVRPRRRNR